MRSRHHQVIAVASRPPITHIMAGVARGLERTLGTHRTGPTRGIGTIHQRSAAMIRDMAGARPISLTPYRYRSSTSLAVIPLSTPSTLSIWGDRQVGGMVFERAIRDQQRVSTRPVGNASRDIEGERCQSEVFNNQMVGGQRLHLSRDVGRRALQLDTISRPLATSHTRAVRSLPAVTTHLPSGLNIRVIAITRALGS